MIVIEKLKEYEEYHGYYDGFYIQKVKNGINITSDVEWDLIDDFIQDVSIVRKGLASKGFAEKLNKKLKGNCDSEETIKYLKQLAEKGW